MICRQLVLEFVDAAFDDSSAITITPDFHRYYFKLYALDTKLVLKPRASKEELLRAMEGHLLAESELMGTYRRRK